MKDHPELSDAQLVRLRELVDEPTFTDSRYQLLGRLGRGGMGSVFRVRDSALDREVALKVLSLPGDDARLLDEARVLASLEHPGIVPVHDLGRLADGRVYYTMKRVEGLTFDAHLAAAQPGLRARVALLLRLCDALAFAHDRGVLHLDLKPANVMLGAFGEVLLMDWGLAARGGAAARPAGTAGYMAPEQARGEALDARTDVHALGVLIAGVLPDAPAPLRAVIAKARAAEREERYPSVAALSADLAAWNDDGPVSAYREGLAERLARGARRHRFVLLLLLGFVLVRLAMIFWLRH